MERKLGEIAKYANFEVKVKKKLKIYIRTTYVHPRCELYKSRKKKAKKGNKMEKERKRGKKTSVLGKDVRKRGKSRV